MLRRADDRVAPRGRGLLGRGLHRVNDADDRVANPWPARSADGTGLAHAAEDRGHGAVRGRRILGRSRAAPDPRPLARPRSAGRRFLRSSEHLVRRAEGRRGLGGGGSGLGRWIIRRGRILPISREGQRVHLLALRVFLRWSELSRDRDAERLVDAVLLVAKPFAEVDVGDDLLRQGPRPSPCAPHRRPATRRW